MTGIVIKGARILGEHAADLVISDGVIQEISTSTLARTVTAGSRVIDADGLILLPLSLIHI